MRFYKLAGLIRQIRAAGVRNFTPTVERIVAWARSAPAPEDSASLHRRFFLELDADRGMATIRDKMGHCLHKSKRGICRIRVGIRNCHRSGRTFQGLEADPRASLGREFGRALLACYGPTNLEVVPIKLIDSQVRLT